MRGAYDQPIDRPSIDSRGAWLRLLAGFSVVFALFQWSAAQFGSDRGQAGVVVAAIVLTGVLGAEVLLFGAGLREAIRRLGLARPRLNGITAAALIAVCLWATVPIFSTFTGATVSMQSGWIRFAPGLFAQAGIAEETLFRAYLFGHLRVSRPFWRAAIVSLLPFVAVHLPLFATMDWPVATAALLLAAATAMPFARLYELGGHTVWAPAIVHAVIQGTVKVVAVSEAWTMAFVLAWMTAGAVVPFAVFLTRTPLWDGQPPNRQR